MKKALTFMEIIASSVILAASIVALLATFVSVKNVILSSRQRLVAANIGRDILEGLYASVREDEWNSSRSPLLPGEYATAYNSTSIGGDKYTASYQVLSMPSAGSSEPYRKVIVTVKYNF